ncbi:MAG: hypothetical protein ABFD77_04665 [Thermotogota bacterium]
MGMGGGGPKSPLPLTVDSFVVRLPLPTYPPRKREPYSSFECAFTKTLERGYYSMFEYMFAAEYRADTIFGSVAFGVVVNGYSAKVVEAIERIAQAYAKKEAIRFAYENQRPPLPLPANTGNGAPFSRETLTTLDGTARFRGGCSGIRALDPALVETVNVVVQRVFAKGGGPQSQ